MNDDTDDGTPDMGRGRNALSVYQVVEAVILAVAFAIVYAFGILHFAGAVAQLWGRVPAVLSATFAVAIAIAFVDAVSRIINQTRKEKYDEAE